MSSSNESSEASALPEKPGRNIWLAPLLAFAVLAVFWTGFIAFTSPSLGGTDTFIFRDAGCNCAAGSGLVSDSVPTDAASIPPKLFAAYTPGAPLLFAPAASIFGCSAYTDTYYNFFLLVLLSLLVLWLYFRFEERLKRRVIAALVTGFTLPGGLFLTDLDRPEAIALVAALGLLLLWQCRSGVAAKSLLLGCSGLVFLIHPYAGIVEFLLFLFLLLWAPGQRNRLKIVLLGSALSAAMVILCALYLRHLDPSTMQRFLGHALGSKSGAGVILSGQATPTTHNPVLRALHTYARVGSKYFDKTNFLSGAPVVALLCGFAMLLIFVARTRGENRDRRALLQLGCLFCILFLFPAAVFLPQANYFAASNAFLFAIIAVGGYGLSNQLQRNNAALLLLLIAAFFSLPEFSLHLIAASESHASYVHASEQAVRVKDIFEKQGESQPRILVDSSHFFLYKPYFRYLYNAGYLHSDASTAEFQGLVRCYTGQLAFNRSQLKWAAPLHENNWKLIDGGEDVERITLFGHPIQRRNWTWSCDVYERVAAKP